MIWLAIDSSSSSGSIALEADGDIIYQCYFNIDITHSETLMPQIDTALKICNLAVCELGGIVTTIGPGSFTGLRIGLATAKGIAYGRKIPLITYSSLELVAANCYESAYPILVCLDAKMKELYAAMYSPTLDVILEPQVINAEELAKQIDKPVLLVGNAFDKLMPLLKDKGLEVKLAAQHQHLPMAAGLFALMKLKPQSVEYDFDEIARLEPQYLRESTAQIRFNQKKKPCN